jgi:hypothetical protein
MSDPNNGAFEIFKSILATIATVSASVISYQLIDVGRKRKVETYWKIEDEYKSDPQSNARRLIEEVKQDFDRHATTFDPQESSNSKFKKLVEYYEQNYHNSSNQSRKEIARDIRTRLRLLNQVGILLRKRMISKDLIFSLIGLGFEIDHPTLVIILAAHRRSHNAPYLYNQFEYLWRAYLRWKRR